MPVELHLCPECGKFYEQKRKLVRHRKQHHKLDDRPHFPCSQCDKKFTMSNDLHSHMNSVHLKIKSFKCEMCKRLFAHKRSLEPGRYSCTVNTQDVCSHCGKIFKSRGSLQDHACSHDSSFPYPCNKCLICFSYRNQLRHRIARNAFLSYFPCHRMFILVQSEQSHVKPQCDNCNRSLCNSCNKVALEAMWKSTYHVIIWFCGWDKDISSRHWFLRYCGGL